MALPARYCPSCLSSIRSSTSTLAFRPKPSASSTPRTSLASPVLLQQQSRHASQSANALKYKRKDIGTAQKKKKARTTYLQPDLRRATQFSLIDAMRYIKAVEVGRNPKSSKYELHIRLRTVKNGPTVRNRMRLPHPVKTDLRIAVICPPDSPHAKAATEAGASLVGETNIFDAVKAGTIEFDRCICHADSLPLLAKSGIARILGPRGLMPSAKTGTVVRDVGTSVRDMAGASEYRERFGVVRLAIGQLGYTPEELSRNIKACMDGIRKDINALSDRINKDIHEVVLSSTNGPGLSLNGEMRGLSSPPVEDLSTL